MSSIRNRPDVNLMIDPRARIAFVHLRDIPSEEIIAHMSDPRVGKHMPLLTFDWNSETLTDFLAIKDAYWRRDGLGHWAILSNGTYVGWGGFQKEGDEWDFGLVLRPEFFGLGMRITQKALMVARAEPRIPFVTFLLPPSRKNLRALIRLGAQFTGEVDLGCARFLKFRLQTA
ncbi:MAG: GNAT family N-acetyltransferase [Hyphomicrobiaceae bacterium]